MSYLGGLTMSEQRLIDANANKMKISLAQDQLIHLMQVVLTWAWCFMVHIG